MAFDSALVVQEQQNLIVASTDTDRAVVHRPGKHLMPVAELAKAGTARDINEEREGHVHSSRLGPREPQVVHDERVKERNRVQRMLIRPEMGALIGAIALFVIFLIVAPPFREAASLATVLYASPRSASWRAAWRC